MCEVLIINNDSEYLNLLSEDLKKKNIKAASCSSITEAVNLEMEALPCLIMLDIMLPSINGLKLLKKIKSTPETSGIYVILMAPIDENDSMEMAYEMGADEFFFKVKDFRALMFRVSKTLEQQKKLKELREKEESIVAYCRFISILKSV